MNYKEVYKRLAELLEILINDESLLQHTRRDLIDLFNKIIEK